MTLHARTALALTACAAVGALGCGTPDVATAPHGARAAALSQSGAPRHHVTGSGHTPVGMTEDLREFTFHAVEHPDGTVSGSYRVERTDTGVFFTVDVRCMTVVGNTAWVAGRITETNSPAIRVGTVSYFWAVDGGEGAGAQDIVSIARINDRDEAEAEFCTTLPKLLPPLAVEMGNVQIR
jgi:hypothetical protein